jgi:chemotaxis protein MotC
VTRKKKFILVGALLTTFLAAGGAGAWFMRASILSHLPFIGQADTSSGTQPEESQINVKHEVQPAPHAEDFATEEAGHAETEAGTADDAHGGAAKSGKSTPVELVPAPDYKAPNSRGSAIIEAVRQMNSLQTRMAKGEKDAPKALKSVMLRVPDIVSKIDATKISALEIQSVALYVLSGGNPLVIEPLLKSEALLADHKLLLTGVMSYATADFAKASEALIPLDPKRFETMLSAQLSVAQAQLATNAAHSENIKRLAFAADVMPGTLIEEAATRRIIPYLVGAGDASGLSYWTQRYLRRFSDSLYYLDFEVSLVNGLATMLAEKSALDENFLVGIFLSAGQIRSATVAQKILVKAILDGNVASCALIEKSLETTFGLQLEIMRPASVLIKICKMIEGGAEELATLKSIDVSGLDEDVKLHLSKAIAMSEEIQKDSLPQDDGSAGPHLPISADEAYAPLFASVAQQMDASVSAIRRVDDDEADSDN